MGALYLVPIVAVKHHSVFQGTCATATTSATMGAKVATQLKNIVRFVNVAAGATVALPHGLSWSPPGGGDQPQIPDHVTPGVGGFGFVITADATNVTVTNTNPVAASVDVLCELWHTFERAFGDVAIEELVPRPFIEDSGGGGGGDCEDCLATNDEPPTQIDIGDAQVVGVLPLGARADHQHAFPAPPAPLTVTGPTNGTGAATTAARADHQHRLGLLVGDEGVVVGPGRPEINFIGMGVGAVDNPGLDRVDVTIPGDVTDGAVVKRSLYKGDTVQVTAMMPGPTAFVDGMSGGSVVVPIDGDYLVIFESEGDNQAASGKLEIGISKNSLVAVVADSSRLSKGASADTRAIVTSVQLPGCVAGDLVRCLFRRSAGAGAVSLMRRHLIIIKVQ